MYITGELYLQAKNLNKNSFQELRRNISGIYVVANPENFSDFSVDDYSKFTSYLGFTGLTIPVFHTKWIHQCPVDIGVQNLIDVTPGVAIGRGNMYVAVSGKNAAHGELVIGDYNFTYGRENALLGYSNKNYYGRNNRLDGTYNTTADSTNVLLYGNTNYASGIYSANILGKNNIFECLRTNIYQGPHQALMKSGDYQSYNINVLGEQNRGQSGIKNITTVGSYNFFSRVAQSIAIGELNHIRNSSGNYSTVFGYRNDISESYDINLLGAENSAIGFSSKSTLVGDKNLLNSSVSSYLYGSSNICNTGSNNLIFGDQNETYSNMECIFGRFNRTNLYSTNNLSVGNDNFLNGADSNSIFGSSNLIHQNVLSEIFGIRLENEEIISQGPYNAYESGQSFQNLIVGRLNKTYLNSFTDTVGSENKVVDNNKCTILGKSNLLINNVSSMVFGNDNLISGTSGVCVFGNNNNIINQVSGIFIGFNFKNTNGNMSGIGINITPNGINLYGALRMNGVNMNVP